MNINDEIKAVLKEDFKLGEYIYMGIAKIKGKTVVISVGYKIDYCIKKAKEFAELVPDINFYKVNKIRVGELESCCEFKIN
jgi:hypothetical protein